MEHVIRFEINATRYLFWRQKAWALQAYVAATEGATVNLITEISFRPAPMIAITKSYQLAYGDPLRFAIHRARRRRPDDVMVSVEAASEGGALLRWKLPDGIEFKRFEDETDEAAG